MEPDDGHAPFRLITPNPPKARVEPVSDFPLAFPVLAPGSIASTDTSIVLRLLILV